jgi:SNF2 domain-containing protein
MRSVQHTGELDRILALPRRTDTYEDLIDPLSAHLRKDHVCAPDCAGGVQRLKLLQVAALVEAHDHRGLFLQGPIGAGKTIVSLLLPTVLEARRPLLIIPGGSIVDKTVIDIKRLRQHWRILPIQITTYEFLSIEAHAKYLEEFKPDLLIMDEAHRAKSVKSAIHRRLKRFRAAYPDVPICAMSGTPAKRSIKDFAPCLFWCLRELCPLPVHESDLQDWAAVLDAGVPDENRLAPGALHVFGPNIRQGVRARIFSTPGALASDKNEVDAKLVITLRSVPLAPAEDIHYQRLYEEWATPDGHEFFDAIDLWRYARQLALGFFGVWDPRPPQDWLEARKEWYAGCREVLAHSRRLDTEKQVASYIDSRPDHKLYDVLQCWRRLKHTFIPNSEPRWTGETALLYAAKWLEGGGVAWTEHVPFGQRLAQITGLPYFGAEGKTPDGQHSIVTYRGPAYIASWKANKEGLNLQHYDRGLLTSMSPTAILYDQVMGRQHRQGQKSPVVTFDIPISCREQLAGFERARLEDGPFHKDLLAIPSRLIDSEVKSDKIVQHGYAWIDKRARR